MKIDKHLLEEHNHMRKLMNLPLLSEQNDSGPLKIPIGSTVELDCKSWNPDQIGINSALIGKVEINGTASSSRKTNKEHPNFVVSRERGMDTPVGGGDKEYLVNIEEVGTQSSLQPIFGNGSVLTYYAPEQLNKPTSRHYCKVDKVSDSFGTILTNNGIRVV